MQSSCMLLAILLCSCLENFIFNVGREREVFDCTERELGKEYLKANGVPSACLCFVL